MMENFKYKGKVYPNVTLMSKVKGNYRGSPGVYWTFAVAEGRGHSSFVEFMQIAGNLVIVNAHRQNVVDAENAVLDYIVAFKPS